MELKISKTKNLDHLETECLVLFFSQVKKKPKSLLLLTKKVKQELMNFLKLGDFRAKEAEMVTFYPRDSKIKRLCFVGLGESKDIYFEQTVNIVKKLYLYLESLNIKRTVLALPKKVGSLNEQNFLWAVADGLNHGWYQFGFFKAEVKKDKRRIEQVELLTDNRRAASQVVKYFPLIVEATTQAKNLTNLPANEATPGHLVWIAQQIAQANKAITVKVINESEAKKLGMGAFCAVARGSDCEGQFIILDYNSKAKKNLVLIGKGVTFDAGGINIKPSDWLYAMKYDMAGAALILALFKILPQLKVRYRVIGLLPCVENLPSGKAMKAGDIIKTLSGKTVEIINTDAEGRLLLVDAIAYAQRYRPQTIIDIATLTGAMFSAVGPYGAGVMANNRQLLSRMTRASQASEEHLVQFPLWPGYKESLQSKLADLRNIGLDYQSSIPLAGYFLSEFVGNTAWLHLDIASAVMDKDDLATGWGIKLLINFLNYY